MFEESSAEKLDEGSVVEEMVDTEAVLTLIDPEGAKEEGPQKYLFYNYYSDYLGKT